MDWLDTWFLPFLWVAYFVYWRVLSGKVKASERIEPRSSRWLRAICMLCGFVLLCAPGIPIPVLYRQFLPAGEPLLWTGTGITVLGLLFSVWARRHLGANWSQSVTIKQNHELITTGPYAFVRHPIYTGLLTGLLGTGIALSQWRGVLAFALITLVLLYKLRLEERWMRLEFGDSYASYARRVPALLPGLF